MPDRYPWLWDVEMDSASFDALLAGMIDPGPRERTWALLRLIEYAPYSEIRRLLPLDYFLKMWPEISGRVRSLSRRDGMDFYYSRRLQRMT